MNPICPKCGARVAEVRSEADGEHCICRKCGSFVLAKKVGATFVITRTSDAYGKSPVIKDMTLEDILALAGTKPFYVLKIKHRSLQVQDGLPEIEIVDDYD